MSFYFYGSTVCSFDAKIWYQIESRSCRIQLRIQRPNGIWIQSEPGSETLENRIILVKSVKSIVLETSLKKIKFVWTLNRTVYHDNPISCSQLDLSALFKLNGSKEVKWPFFLPHKQLTHKVILLCLYKKSIYANF